MPENSAKEKACPSITSPSHGRKDEIADFEKGDSICTNRKAVGNFSQIKSHTGDHCANVWIVAGGDTLIIAHMQKADLQAGDFQF